MASRVRRREQQVGWGLRWPLGLHKPPQPLGTQPEGAGPTTPTPDLCRPQTDPPEVCVSTYGSQAVGTREGEAVESCQAGVTRSPRSSPEPAFCKQHPRFVASAAVDTGPAVDNGGDTGASSGPRTDPGPPHQGPKPRAFRWPGGWPAGPRSMAAGPAAADRLA
ncbi:unnamed protein product [Rangifer tarandus platyrhynchus]|uniref:Uncharacterized protein n=1 Tax=Rangifer tarandus platyrhynchus TaxID=3082113 RepID=A0AC59ZYF8_RANTA